ncbi:hypothetical protein [Kribbella sindirgiensis]|uniref:Uncharacterized protein n=1 Tax=Kribbella sindirgiensis TaxID=1124744 RepID=A0A4R0HYR6_9ACTN|nr:hypothetical protein [Kribbella sindirgiensis]TCC16297.1 hypothetical protein E0H50_40650 [Kribbella sindirgiensis]
MNADRLSVCLLLVVGLLSACSGQDDRVKLKAALENGPLSVSVDSSGKADFGAAEQFELDILHPGKGVSTAAERVEEQRAKEAAELRWYVVFVLASEGGKEAVFEFAPDGLLQVSLSGKVVQSLRMRITVVELTPGATAEITQIAAATSGPGGTLPDPLLPKELVGRWTGKLSFFERSNPLGKGYTRPDRPITITIPSRKLPGSKVVGTAYLPKADFTVSFGDREQHESRPAQKNTFVLDTTSDRPISIQRVYVRIADGSGPPFSLTVLANGKLYVEQYKSVSAQSELDLGQLEQAALLTRAD